MLARFALVTFAALSACGPSDAPSDADPSLTSPAATTALADTAMVRDVSPEGTRRLLADGVAGASPSVGIQMLDLWVARLDTVASAGEIRGDLTRLRNLLQSSPLDGPAIGRTMASLGEQTATLAEAGTPLDALAATLREQGERLVPDSTRADSPDAPETPVELGTEGNE